MDPAVSNMLSQVSQIYAKVVAKPTKKPRKQTIQQFFIKQFKDGKYHEFNRVQVDGKNVLEFAHSVAQINYKLLTDEQMKQVREDYTASITEAAMAEDKSVQQKPPSIYERTNPENYTPVTQPMTF